MSLPFYIHPLFHGLRQLPVSAFFVGGIPRDVILNRTPKDIDIAFFGTLHSIETLIEQSYNISHKVKTRFFTVNYTTERGFTINLAHFRKEQYPEPASLPYVTPVFSIEQDVRRRDFTINSLYMDISTLNIIDPLDGLSDIKRGILRVNYKGSFKDDPTRIFRGIRYKVRMGLKYASSTLREIESGIKYIPLLSKQRIVNELKKISEEKSRIEAIKEILEFNILGISVNRNVLPILYKLNETMPYTKDTWIFFFAPLFGESLKFWPLTRREKKIINAFLEKESNEVFYHRIFKEFSSQDISALFILKRDLNLKWMAKLKKRIETNKVKSPKIRAIIQCIMSCSNNEECMAHCLQVL